MDCTRRGFFGKLSALAAAIVGCNHYTGPLEYATNTTGLETLDVSRGPSWDRCMPQNMERLKATMRATYLQCDNPRRLGIVTHISE